MGVPGGQEVIQHRFHKSRWLHKPSVDYWSLKASSCSVSGHWETFASLLQFPLWLQNLKMKSVIETDRAWEHSSNMWAILTPELFYDSRESKICSHHLNFFFSENIVQTKRKKKSLSVVYSESKPRAMEFSQTVSLFHRRGSMNVTLCTLLLVILLIIHTTFFNDCSQTSTSGSI